MCRPPAGPQASRRRPGYLTPADRAYPRLPCVTCSGGFCESGAAKALTPLRRVRLAKDELHVDDATLLRRRRRLVDLVVVARIEGHRSPFGRAGRFNHTPVSYTHLRAH